MLMIQLLVVTYTLNNSPDAVKPISWASTVKQQGDGLLSTISGAICPTCSFTLYSDLSNLAMIAKKRL